MENRAISWTFGGKETFSKILIAAFKSYWLVFIFAGIFSYFIYLIESQNGESYAWPAFGIFVFVSVITFLLGAGVGNSPIFYLLRDKLYKRRSYILNNEGLVIKSDNKNVTYKFDEFDSFDWQGEPRDYVFYKVLGVKFWIDCKTVRKKILNTQEVVLVYATLDNYKEVREFLESKISKKPIEKQKSFVLWSRNKSF